uniref:Glycosyl transferase CAP10 domain-containing protein n=1 Tax=Rhipicephalus microplus TaxID=6941 RepID=A0A6G5AES3_RHIMP
MKKMLREALRRFDRPGSVSFCHYAVVKNQVYRKCYGQHVGFNMFMDQILLSLARKVRLPDIEMLVNLGDWPLEQEATPESTFQFFSWCGSKSSTDIVMPTYDITESSLEMMGRVTLDVLSVQGNSGPAWKEKCPCGFWRGRDSCPERLDLVALSRRHPDLLNASLTNFSFFGTRWTSMVPRPATFPSLIFLRCLHCFHLRCLHSFHPCFSCCVRSTNHINTLFAYEVGELACVRVP